MTNIFANDVGGQLDAVTNLRAPTHVCHHLEPNLPLSSFFRSRTTDFRPFAEQYGRPNWDRIFQSVAQEHPATEVGVFFCGVRLSLFLKYDLDFLRGLRANSLPSSPPAFSAPLTFRLASTAQGARLDASHHVQQAYRCRGEGRQVLLGKGESQ